MVIAHLDGDGYGGDGSDDGGDGRGDGGDGHVDGGDGHGDHLGPGIGLVTGGQVDAGHLVLQGGVTR